MGRNVRIAFIGAGNVNFGGGEGPWDHASRLEKIGGVEVVGVADVDLARAKARLAGRRNAIYSRARPYADYRVMLSEQKPEAVWIGVPPEAHGMAQAGKDIELCCARAGVHMFIEKPLSSARPEEVRPVADALAASGLVVSVGYMFRYSQAIETMRGILEQTPGGAKAFVARYNCAYSQIRKAEWWDVRKSGGPIVEQATHFVDLSRCFCGEADLGTVRAVRILGAEAAGAMLDVPRARDGRPCDAGVPPEFRGPRSTAAVWKFANGAVGSLTHSTWLHGKKYHTSLEVWGDGLCLALDDPYGRPRLSVRRPHSDDTEEMLFDDDPYLAENVAFLEAVRRRDAAPIRSLYHDAFRTYELTWAITDA